MCGRTACTLDPDVICKLCRFQTSHGETKNPVWRNDLNVRQYAPCYNLGPTKFSPVILSKKHFDRDAEHEDRILASLNWGFPSFAATSDSQRLINGRAETALEKPTFKTPLKAGKRCVILADGYFEWKRHSEKNKQPFLVHFPQPDGLKIGDPLWKELPIHMDDDDLSTKVPRLLTMAGLFNTVKIQGQECLSYIVLTVGASSAVSHIHDRMPAILDGETAVQEWLDYGNVKAEQAMEILQPITNLEYYEVSPAVNNVRNNTTECIEAYVKK